MNFLRAQINPHFLYNMLFSIRCTVEMGKSEQAVQMIQAFTDLLRTTLKTTEDAIALRDEFENTRKYLVVQKLRYGEKVHFEMDLAPETELCRVPPLIFAAAGWKTPFSTAGGQGGFGPGGGLLGAGGGQSDPDGCG